MSRKDGSLTDVRALFCPTCQSVKSVIDRNDELSQPIGYLECGHTRSAFLPRTAGLIGLEDLQTEIGQKLFAGDRKRAYEKSYATVGAMDVDTVINDEDCAADDSLEEADSE